MQIPGYYIEALSRRLKRIADNATCDKSDTRTANALRLLNEDVRKLERLIKKHKDEPIP